MSKKNSATVYAHDLKQIKLNLALTLTLSTIVYIFSPCKQNSFNDFGGETFPLMPI
jgi:hypothetical protein